MNFEEKGMKKAEMLIRSYTEQTLGVVRNELWNRENKRRQEAERRQRRLVDDDWKDYEWQKQHGTRFGGIPSIDLSSVSFSSRDLARIEIPQSFSRIEDKTLAYCLKYWNQINDDAFERILYLYSRKYNTKNYEAFKAIRTGRETRMRYDEILTSVMSVLITGYYYSVQGDRYLQQQWNVIKSYISRVSVQKPSLLVKAEAVVSRQAASRTAQPKTAKPAAKVSSRAASKAAPAKKTTVPKTAPVVSRLETRAATIAASREGRKSSVQTAQVSEKQKPAPGASVKKAASETANKEAQPVKTAKPRTEPKAGGSVADKLRELSGRSYDIYHDRFLDNAVSAIRKVLSYKRGIFFTLPERVETVIYKFLKDHYSDPYMNWADSSERTELAGLGFDIPSLDPIIRECFKTL
jgi:hypothetical protein